MCTLQASGRGTVTPRRQESPNHPTVGVPGRWVKGPKTVALLLLTQGYRKINQGERGPVAERERQTATREPGIPVADASWAVRTVAWPTWRWRR